jgi:hypothetical protein
LSKLKQGKNINYVLITALIVVWGSIMYQFFFKNSNDENLSEMTYEAIQDNEPFQRTKKKYTLLLKYADPFKGQSTTVDRSNKVPVKKIQKVVRWPRITYKGSVKNHSTLEAIALLTINKKSLLIKEGEVKSGYLVKAVYNDSVRLIFEGQEKTFYR